MTAEQYDKLTEMQRIKPKDDEEAKVTLVPIVYTSSLLCSCAELCCLVFFLFVLSSLIVISSFNSSAIPVLMPNLDF
jgi:hypothetical protein